MTQPIDTILISHSHKDSVYVHELVNIIKVTAVEENDVRIICSSYPGHNIPPDVNIYDYLKQELRGNVWVIYVLSNNYYASYACLNEMGATWVQNKRYSTFITPNFSYKQIAGAIDPSRNALKLDDKSNLNDFKMLILDEFHIKINDNIWESVRDTSLKRIKDAARVELEQNSFVKVQLESVRILPEQNIRIAIRTINNLTYPIEFNSIKVNLKDNYGNSLLYEDESYNQLLYSGENRIIFISTQKKILDMHQLKIQRMK